MGQQLFIFGAAFLGSAVETTEALTIVLAVGLTRGWREPLLGTLLAIVLLGLLVLVFGQLIVTTIPEWALAAGRHAAASVRLALAAQGRAPLRRCGSDARR